MLSTENQYIEQLDEIEGVPCSCGMSKRASFSLDNSIASVHLIDISKDSKTHFHKKTTEMYLVLEGEGFIELNGTLHPVKPMSTVMITPGTRHRAVGKMKIINIPFPMFDESDEYFD